MGDTGSHLHLRWVYDAIVQDVAFIMTTYMPLDDVPSQLPSRKKQREIKNTLLEYMKFSDDRQTIQTAMLKQSEKWVRMTQNPLEITNHILRHLEENKWVLPKYSLLQDCIGAALKQEEKRLMKSVSRYLTKKVTQSLEYLLASETHRHIITELKFDAKSFKMQSMQQEIKKLTWCQPIYHFSKRLLPKLSLSRGVIAHYSDLAKWYSVDRLKKLPRTLVYFYLICYVSHRYERLSNNLIQAFIYYVDKYHQAGKQYAKNELPTFSDQLETHKKAIGELIKFYVDPEILSLSGNEIQQQAFDILPEEEMITVSQHLLEGSQSLKRQERKLIWAYHGNNYQAVLIYDHSF